MSLRIFEAPAQAAESPQVEDVSFFARLLFCGLASVVAVVPALVTTYSALGITNVFRGMTNAETAGMSTVLAGLHTFNRPLVVALGFSALLAFGIALMLATNAKHRLASVGLPYSIGVPIIAATPAVLLWFAETTTMDVLAGKLVNTPVTDVAQTISTLLFCAAALGLLAQGAVLFCAIISLCIPVRKRTDASSLRRAFIWAVSGTLLLVFAAAYFVLV